MFESLQDFFEVTSLWLTLPCVALAIWVAVVFVKTAHNIVFHKTRTTWGGGDWIAIGIAIGFTGQALDNVYWFIPWTASFLQSTWTPFLVEIGVFFNVPSRQLCGILAAYCHLKGAEAHGLIKPGYLDPVTKIVTALGMLYVAGLFYLKGIGK